MEEPNNPGRPDSLTQQAQQALEKGLKEGRWLTVPQMHVDLTKEFGIIRNRPAEPCGARGG